MYSIILRNFALAKRDKEKIHERIKKLEVKNETSKKKKDDPKKAK